MADRPYIIHANLPNAPVLNGTPGSLINLLDAVLVNGWNIGTITSIVVEDGIATCTFNSTNGEYFEDDRSDVKISGMSEPGLNGVFKITDYGSNYVKWETSVSNNTYNDSGTIGIPALGWSKVFSGVNEAVYRTLNTNDNRYFYKIIDKQAHYANVESYRIMENINTGKEPISTFMDSNSFYVLGKSLNANNKKRFWMIIGDDIGFYYLHNGVFDYSRNLKLDIPLYATYLGSYVDSANEKMYNACLALNKHLINNSFSYFYNFDSNSHYNSIPIGLYYIAEKLNFNSSYILQNQIFLAKNIHYIESVRCVNASNGFTFNNNTSNGMIQYFSGRQGFAFPDTYTNNLYLTNTALVDTSGSLRGKLPGLYYLNNAVDDNFYFNDFIKQEKYKNRKIFCLSLTTNKNYSDYNLVKKERATVLIDTSEWRTNVW